MYPAECIYIVGTADLSKEKLANYNPKFCVGFVVYKDTGDIFSCNCSCRLQVTNEFVQSLFAGKSLKIDSEMIKQDLEEYYIGPGKQEILDGFRDAQAKFNAYRSGKRIKLV